MNRSNVSVTLSPKLTDSMNNYQTLIRNPEGTCEIKLFTLEEREVAHVLTMMKYGTSNIPYESHLESDSDEVTPDSPIIDAASSPHEDAGSDDTEDLERESEEKVQQRESKSQPKKLILILPKIPSPISGAINSRPPIEVIDKTLDSENNKTKQKNKKKKTDPTSKKSVGRPKLAKRSVHFSGSSNELGNKVLRPKPRASRRRQAID